MMADWLWLAGDGLGVRSVGHKALQATVIIIMMVIVMMIIIT